MKEFRVSARVTDKLLTKHGLTTEEVFECFVNMVGPAFEDTRLDHLTNPPTQWFVAETDKRRLLKVVYVEYPEYFAIKSAFDANETWCETYNALCNELNAQ